MDEKPKLNTEQIPSIQGGVSAIGSAAAPIIFVDEFPNSGYYNGICHITCEALRFMHVDNIPVSDRVIVAHLRMNLQGLEALKSAIASIERMVDRPEVQKPPPHKRPE